MHPALHFKSAKRATIIILIVMSLVVGVALAILQARGTLTGNTISTASTNLLVSTNGRDYTTTVAGFNFDGIIPGGYPAPKNGFPVYVKNIGTTTLDLRLALDGTPSNPSATDLNKFNFALMDGGIGTPQSFTLGSLLSDGQSLADELSPGATRQYTLQVSAAEDADQAVSISDIHLAFIGTPQDPNDPNR